MDFKPHLLLKIQIPADRLIISLLGQKEVLLAYDGRWCAFQYKQLDVPTETSVIKLSVELCNGFLHYGQFSSGQPIQLYHAGMHLKGYHLPSAACLPFFQSIARFD